MDHDEPFLRFTAYLPVYKYRKLIFRCLKLILSDICYNYICDVGLDVKTVVGYAFGSAHIIRLIL